MAISFPKTYRSPQDLVALLKSRGLRITDDAQAENEIKNIGYYRLSAYLYPLISLPKEAQQFKPGASFETALRIYAFDMELRTLLFKYLANVEIALRSALANIVSKASGDMFWMTDQSNFSNRNIFQRTMGIIDKELTNTKEEFITHFRTKYSNPYPPAWMLVEILPIGTLNHIFNNLKDNKVKKTIAARFRLTLPVFSSWITIVALMRNACCHHSRVWNKENAILPVEPRKISTPWISASVPTNRLFYDICILKHLLDAVNPSHLLKTQLQSLLNAYPEIDTAPMGFPKAWEQEPLWS